MLVSVYPFKKNNGIAIISPAIKNSQFSILRFAISHIPTKKSPVINVST